MKQVKNFKSKHANSRAQKHEDRLQSNSNDIFRKIYDCAKNSDK